LPSGPSIGAWPRRSSSPRSISRPLDRPCRAPVTGALVSPLNDISARPLASRRIQTIRPNPGTLEVKGSRWRNNSSDPTRTSARSRFDRMRRNRPGVDLRSRPGRANCFENSSFADGLSIGAAGCRNCWPAPTAGPRGWVPKPRSAARTSGSAAGVDVPARPRDPH